MPVVGGALTSADARRLRIDRDEGGRPHDNVLGGRRTYGWRRRFESQGIADSQCDTRWSPVGPSGATEFQRRRTPALIGTNRKGAGPTR